MPISIPTLALARRYTNKKIQDVELESGNLPGVGAADDGKTLIVQDGEWSVENFPPSDLQNLVDGSAAGSMHSINARSEDANYTMGVSAFAEGAGTTASGNFSHAEGGGTTATGISSHAEGGGTVASGDTSHAEGGGSRATGGGSHAEGNSTVASGGASHAEGGSTTASGSCAHAEGSGTVASGDSSHAAGSKTIANHKSQYALGEYNIADSSEGGASDRGAYIEIVGNGTGENNRSNARTLDWDGNEILAGNLTVEGGSITVGNTTFTEQDLGGGLKNLVDGSFRGAVRGIGTAEESSDYTVGFYSFAEGYNTKAAGAYSHAEGTNSVATNDSAHAEGKGTTASGKYSHSEGQETVASNEYSHAEGNNTTASGTGSHAEGTLTTASGSYAHAEGNASRADGLYSHSEGRSSAAGHYSHAEGISTLASHRSQHVFGEYNETDPSTASPGERGTYVEIVGNGTATSGNRSNARTLDWSGNEVLAGKLTVGAAPVNDMDVTTKKYVNDYVNESAVVVAGEGTGSTVQGLMGNDGEDTNNIATGDYAHVEGGRIITDSSTETTTYYKNTASGESSHAEGYGTTASSEGSHAEGNNTTASGSCSHAECGNTVASGMFSHAEGLGGTYTVNGTTYQSGAKGLSDHTEGYQTLTESNQPGNHAEGYQTRATGGAAHAEGVSTVASGMHSHAEGANTTASGMQSHVEGANTTASGTQSHAEGGNTTASASQAHAEGYNTTASEICAHAEGGSTVASGAQSHAEGGGTTANHRSQHVFGEHNIADPSAAQPTNRGTYVEIVGNGTANNARSNARTLDWAGNEVLAGNLTINGGSITVGNTTFTENDLGSGLKNLVDGSVSGSVRGVNTTAEDANYTIGMNAFAEGYNTKASGSNSHAEGISTEAKNVAAHAEGSHTSAGGFASHSEGEYTIANGETAHAEGRTTQALGANSHAEGFTTVANHASQHVFGECNIPDPSTAQPGNRGTYVEIVGNGIANTRSNARTLDWDGNEVLAGKLTVGAAPTNNMDVATKQYVDNATSKLVMLTVGYDNNNDQETYTPSIPMSDILGYCTSGVNVTLRYQDSGVYRDFVLARADAARGQSTGKLQFVNTNYEYYSAPTMRFIVLTAESNDEYFTGTWYKVTVEEDV